MFRRIFILAAAMLAASGVSYAQEDNTSNVTKSLTAYVCAWSGNVNPQAVTTTIGDQTFTSGNILSTGYEAGFTFAQNFASAEWFSLALTIAVCGATSGVPVVNGVTEDARNNVEDVTGYAALNLGFSPYFSVDIYANSVIALNPTYSVRFGANNNQRYRIRAILCLSALGGPLYTTLRDDTEGSTFVNGDVVNLLRIRTDYQIQFHKNLNFNTELEIRSSGDTTEVFRDNLQARWNNTLNWWTDNNLSGYFMFRYNPRNIATDTVSHQIWFLAGVFYSYDLSSL